MTTQQQQNPQLVLKLLWGALAAAQLMFIFLAQTMVQSEAPPATDFETIRMVLTLVAGVTLVMSFVMAKFGAKMAASNLKKRGVQVESADIATIAQLLVVANILRWALLESVSLNGFMLSLFSKDPRYVMAFAAVSLVGFALTFPSERNLRSMVSA